MVAVREAVFPRDTETVSALVGADLRRTEVEKQQRGLVAAGPLDERYAREIADPATVFAGRRVYVAEVDGVDCGVVVAAESADGTEISRFWTTPDARGRGVGSMLVSAAMKGAARPVRLSVWRWRGPALRLYRRHGFEVVPSWDDRPDLVCLELRDDSLPRRATAVSEVVLTGELRCADDDEVARVRAHLPAHIAATRDEPGCLFFEVVPSDEPRVWIVTERFVDDDAFSAHQHRTRASAWGRETAGIERRYVVRR